MFIYLYIFSFLVLLKIARWPQKPNSSEPRTKINSICSWITTENARRGAEREKREESVCVGRWEKLIKNYAIFYLAWNMLRMRNVNAWNWTDRNCLYDSVCVTVRLNVYVSVCPCVFALLCVACKSFNSFCDNHFFNYVCIKVSTAKHRRKSLKNNIK